MREKNSAYRNPKNERLRAKTCQNGEFKKRPKLDLARPNGRTAYDQKKVSQNRQILVVCACLRKKNAIFKIFNELKIGRFLL